MKNKNPEKQNKPRTSLLLPLTTLNTQIPTSETSLAPKTLSYFQIPIVTKQLQISPENSPRPLIYEPRFIQKQTHFTNLKKINNTLNYLPPFLTNLNLDSFNPVKTLYLKTKPMTLKPKLLFSKSKETVEIIIEPFKDLYSEPLKPSFLF